MFRLLTAIYRLNVNEYIYIYKVKVKEYRHRPGVAQKVPGS